LDILTHSDKVGPVAHMSLHPDCVTNQVVHGASKAQEQVKGNPDRGSWRWL